MLFELITQDFKAQGRKFQVLSDFSQVPCVNSTVFVLGYWAPGRRFVDAWTKTSETSQTSQSLFGKPVKRSLRAVFLACKFNCFV